MRQRYEEQAYANSMQTEVVDKVSVIPGEVERFLQKVLGKVEYIDHFPVHLLLDVFGSAGFKDIVDDQQQLFAAGLGA